MLDETTFRTKIGRKIRLLRVNLDLSQARLAARAGLNPTYISHIENGKYNITALALAAICEALEISLSEFFADFK